MPYLADGDSAIYQQCDDPDCPDKREGYEHAHMVRVERSDGSVERSDSQQKK